MIDCSFNVLAILWDDQDLEVVGMTSYDARSSVESRQPQSGDPSYA